MFVLFSVFGEFLFAPESLPENGAVADDAVDQHLAVGLEEQLQIVGAELAAIGQLVDQLAEKNGLRVLLNFIVAHLLDE